MASCSFAIGGGPLCGDAPNAEDVLAACGWHRAPPVAPLSDETQAALNAEEGVRPVLNPEEEAPLPLPAAPRPQPQWSEWAQGPVQLGEWMDGRHCAAPSTVKQWRFRKVPGPWQSMIQVRLWSGDTTTQVVHTGNLEAVRTKQREAWDDLWTVELEHEETHGWTPRDIKFHFDKEENALAFHATLLVHLG
jgi:hypothetical protein